VETGLKTKLKKQKKDVSHVMEKIYVDDSEAESNYYNNMHWCQLVVGKSG